MFFQLKEFSNSNGEQWKHLCRDGGWQRVISKNLFKVVELQKKKKKNGKKNTKQDINRETLLCLNKLCGKNTNNLFWLGMKTLD